MKKLFALLLIGCLLIAPLSVSAAPTATQDGLEVIIATDKDAYAAGETILVTVTLRNTGVDEITNVSIATLLPEGLDFVDGDLAVDSISLKPGEVYEAIVTAKTEAPVVDTELTIAEAIALGLAQEHNVFTEIKYTVTGVITEVYNTQYGNMRITDDAGNILTLYGTYSADGSTRYDALEVKPVAGDTVTVCGIVGQYNGTPQIKNGWIIDHVVGEHPDDPVDPPVTPDDPEADTELSIADAIALCLSKDHNVYTAGKYYVSGVITEVYNDVYGNMKITDDAGNILTIYGTYSADGEIRYDALEVKPVAGDTVKIYGIVGQYNGVPQIKNGWIVAHTPAGSEPVDPPVDPDEPVDPSVDPDEPIDPPVDPDEPEKPVDPSPETGDSTSAVWLVVLAVSAVGLVVLACNKKAVRVLSLFLCVAMIASVVPYAGVLAEETAPAPITVEKTITVGETAYTISTTVTYEVIPSEETLIKREVEELLSTKHKLTYNDDGSFRVLIIADCHMNHKANATDVQEVKDRIKLLVDNENPDLVIYTGDNTINSYTEADMRANLDAIVGYVEEKKIPWCHVYGNHDEEYGMRKAKQQEIYESYEYCVSKAGPSDIFGVGNYVLGVYKQDGSLGSVIYCLDSGAYASGGGYDYIKANQVAWYKETSELLQRYNGGEVVEGMMAFHIPLYENRLAYNNRNNKDIVSEWDGERNEDICSSNSDKNDMFETMLERGDIKAVVTGHDHINDYMFNYYGIKLCNSPNVSDLEYHDHRMQGARVFDLNLDTLDNIPTHVTRLETLYEPVDPDLYDTLADNVTLEFTAEAIQNVVITNWNGGALNGKATVSIHPGAGVGGSEAIQVTRNNKENMEFVLDISNPGKLGNNKYFVVWADFTNVEFRKACFGLNTPDGYYRTDDADYKTPFYYLPDGVTDLSQAETLSHGVDGCFGNGDSGSQNMQGKKGYFAFPVEYFLSGSTKLTAETPITGLYFYCSLKENPLYFNTPFFFDDARLVTNLEDLF